ncbi:MAG: Ppx/GppA family phosphatase [Ignavibacteriae bacterium]|nr:Ppx/GppA family phosphatase [Ignavibacteriota bacterium]
MPWQNKILAAIDIGTNSFHLVVAKVDDKGIMKVLTRDKEVVRLGKSSTDMKYISEQAMQRGISTLKRFRLICDSFRAEIRAVATSATREALNKEEFITRVFEATEIRIEVVSGFEEARLIYLGVLQALPVYKEKILLIDIGGGSTEFLIGEKGNVLYANSIKVGAVRLTEKYFSEGKFRKENIDEARLHVKSIINHIVRDLKDAGFSAVIGTSGTITNAGMIINAERNPETDANYNYNNFTYDRKSLNSAVKKITSCERISELKSINGMDADRTDIITAGAVILEQIFSELNLEKITLSNYALREGIIFDTINKEHNTLLKEDLGDIRYRSIISLAENCKYDKPHSEHVTKLALKIFGQIKEQYKLTEKDIEYLEAASILHDIGHNLSHAQHHKHSYYLIRNCELLGFNDEEIEIIANISRYHRKSHPKLKHDNFSKLSPKNKERVRKLAGILRIADGFDRGHNCIIRDVEIELTDAGFEFRVSVNAGTNPELEIWGANMRKTLFEEAFGKKVIILQVGD